MTTAQTSLATTFNHFRGLTVLGLDRKSGAEVTYKVSRLINKANTANPQTDDQFVTLERTDDSKIVATLNPKVAGKLFRQGQANGFRFAPVAAVQAVMHSSDTQLSTDPATESTAQSNEGNNVQTANASSANRHTARRNDGNGEHNNALMSKKDQAIEIFKSLHAKGIARKDVVSKFVVDLGMGNSGAQTYYQKCKNEWAIA